MSFANANIATGSKGARKPFTGPVSSRILLGPNASATYSPLLGTRLKKNNIPKVPSPLAKRTLFAYQVSRAPSQKISTSKQSIVKSPLAKITSSPAAPGRAPPQAKRITTKRLNNTPTSRNNPLSKAPLYSK